MESLDGLRAVAAVVVVARHTVNAIAMPEAVRHALLASPLGLLLSAQGAVRLFFVLSGFVLARSLARGPGSGNVLQFYVRRLFRIHPPYVFGVLVAWLAAFFYAGEYATHDSP